MTEEDTNDSPIVTDAPDFPINAISIIDIDEDASNQMTTEPLSIEIDKNTMCIKAPSHKLDIEERKKPKFK